MTARVDQDNQPPAGLNRELRGDRTIDEMMGFLRGVMAGGTLSERQLLTLGRMIFERQDDLDLHIFASLIDSVSIALEAVNAKKLNKEILANTEREILKVLGTSAEEITVRRSTSIPLTEPAPQVTIPDHVFCFTGKCAFGARTKCEDAVKQLGGRIRSVPTMDTDYLIIGGLASRDWIHSTYGRKIEAALSLNEGPKPASIAIVDEQHFLESIAQISPVQRSGSASVKTGAFDRSTAPTSEGTAAPGE